MLPSALRLPDSPLLRGPGRRVVRSNPSRSSEPARSRARASEAERASPAFDPRRPLRSSGSRSTAPTLQFPARTGAGRSALASAKATRQPRRRKGGRARAGGGGGRVGRWRRREGPSFLLLPAAGPARPQQLETCAEKGTAEVLGAEAEGDAVTSEYRK